MHIHTLESHVRQAQRNGVILECEGDYILQKYGSTKVGRFRVRPKIHKTPMTSRPVINLTQKWIQPIAIFLCQNLKPVQDSLGTVVTRSDQVTKDLHDLSMEGGEHIAIWDVNNLYPSIDLSHPIEVLETRVRTFYCSQWLLASLIINLLVVILRCQTLEHAQRLYQCIKGICTSLAAGVYFANLYLYASDVIAFDLSSNPAVVW